MSALGEVMTTLPVFRGMTAVPKPLPPEGLGSTNSGKAGPSRAGSATGSTVMLTVAGGLSKTPSLAVKVKLSLPLKFASGT